MSLTTYMVQSKDVYHIAWEYGRLLQCDLIAALGDSDGLGALNPGECFQNSGGDTLWNSDEFLMYDQGAWAFPDNIITGPPPTVNHGGDVQSADVLVSSRTDGMLRLDEAGDKLKTIGLKIAANLGKKLRAKAAQMIAARIPGAYRYQALGFRAEARGNTYLRGAVDKLTQAVMSRKRRRVGIQRISTRNTRLKHGVIRFSWGWAWRGYRGNQPITAREWKRRYHIRLAKRRKTNRKGHPTGIHVPPLRRGHARPRKTVVLAGKHGTVTQPLNDWNRAEALQELLSDL